MIERANGGLAIAGKGGCDTDREALFVAQNAAVGRASLAFLKLREEPIRSRLPPSLSQPNDGFRLRQAIGRYPDLRDERPGRIVKLDKRVAMPRGHEERSAVPITGLVPIIGAHRPRGIRERGPIAGKRRGAEAIITDQLCGGLIIPK